MGRVTRIGKRGSTASWAGRDRDRVPLRGGGSSMAAASGVINPSPAGLSLGMLLQMETPSAETHGAAAER